MEDARAQAHTPPTSETDINSEGKSLKDTKMETQTETGTPTETKTETETAAEAAAVAATCMICGQQHTEGIHILYGFICEPCELEIVRTDVMDAKYPFFVNRMKQLFYKKDA